jgi:Resolvase, N terminal domain/Recombinase
VQTGATDTGLHEGKIAMSPSDRSKPLIPYLRQSKEKDRTISFEDQWRDIRAWAKRQNPSAKLAEGFEEKGVSGNKSWRKRALGAAIAACERGEASGVIVAYQSRLSRESGIGTAEVWEALEKADARLVCVYENIDTARPDSDEEFNFGLQALLARKEWRRAQRNFARGKHAAWEAGQYVAELPAGYGRKTETELDKRTGKTVEVNTGLKPNEHAPAIRRAFELRAASPRASWGEVARMFKDAGLETRFGESQWSDSALRFLIRNPVYTGLHRCTCGCGASVTQPDWEVVPGWLYRKAQVEKVEVPIRNGDGHPLGQGLVKCGTCGAGMTRSIGQRGAMLRCPKRGTGHVAIRYEPALDWVLLEASRALGPRKKDDDDDEVAEAEAQLADARAALAELAASMNIEPGEVPAKSAQARALVAAEDALAGIERPDGSFDLSRILTPLGVKEHIEALPVPEQRRVLRSVIERVVLLKHKGSAQERKQVREGSRHPARGRLRIEFTDGTVSPVEPTLYEMVEGVLTPVEPKEAEVAA